VLHWFRKGAAVLLTICCTAGLAPTALAWLPPSGVAIGGVGLGTTPRQVKKIYGEPTDSRRVYSKSDGAYITQYIYGNSYSITFYELPGGSYADFVNCSADNGLATPAGVLVGMAESVLTSVYGKPDAKAEDPTSHITRYVYKASGGRGEELIFLVQNGKIVNMSACYE
jgi:hypothetical protein